MFAPGSTGKLTGHRDTARTRRRSGRDRPVGPPLSRRWIPLLVSSAVALGLTACASATGSSGTADQTAGVNGKTIVIGNSAILSGPEAAYASISSAFVKYMDQVDAAGGVNGYKIKVVTLDNTYTAAQSVAVARQLVNQDHVFLLTVAGTTPTQALVPIASQLALPVVFVANPDILTGKSVPNMYGIEPSFTREMLFDEAYAIDHLHATKIAYAYENDDIGTPPLGALPKYAQAHSAKLETEVGFEATATDYSSEASRLQASGANVVIVGAGPANLAGLQHAAAAIGYSPKWIGLFASVTPAYVQLAGKLANGVYMDSFYALTNSGTAKVQAFVKAIGTSTGILGELGWTQAAAIVAAIRKATSDGGTLTRGSVVKALGSITGTPVGVWPGVTWTASNHAGATKASIVEIVNGKFVPVTQFEQLPAAP